MKRAIKFSVSPGWKVLINDMGLDIAAVLTKANLPLDLFSRKNAGLTPDEYFRLWLALDAEAGDTELPLALAQCLSVEAFDPPIFAAICSQNFKQAVKRLSHYKPLIGPMELQASETAEALTLHLSCYGADQSLPAVLGMVEMVFFTQLSRLATREQINPISIKVPNLPKKLALYADYFGCTPEVSDKASITFNREDARKPFITHNAQMWDFFESKLNQQLTNLDKQASIVQKVKAVLMSALPGGEVSIEFVADKLAMSKRSLQRKLTAEAETFQSILKAVRLELADHYLLKSEMSLAEISFLLGFQESNSFIRAYSGWKGRSPASFREMQNQTKVLTH